LSTVIDGSNSVTINSGAILGITSGTAVASTSGTSIDFTGIPSWVKRITVMLNGVSGSGTSIPIIQIGSGSVETSGYIAAAARSGGGGTGQTIGFPLEGSSAAVDTRSGVYFLVLQTTSTWLITGTGGLTSNTSLISLVFGAKTITGTLDRVRITTVNGTDTFDAGSINIFYE
jgi:hypothetical protein